MTVRVGVIGSTSDAGIYIAHERGYFRQQGLEIDLTRFASTPAMIPPLGTGQLDVGGGTTSASLINAVASDIPIRIVADKGSMPPGFGYQGIAIRKDLVDEGGFRGCPSFRGYRVGISARGIGPEVAIERMLSECGLELRDVELVTLSYGDMPAAFRNGAIEAAYMIEPGLTRTLSEGLATVYKRVDEFYPDQQIAVLLYSPQFSGDQRAAAQRFMVAYIQGLRDHWDAFTHGIDKAAIVDILRRETEVKDPALFERMPPPGLNPDGYINLRTFSADVEWFIAHDYIKTRVDPAQMVDHSFVDYALERLGRYSGR